MGTSVARGLSLTVVLVMMVVIVPSANNQCRGSASASAEILLKKSNASTSPDFICDSHNKEECLIGDQNLEMEFQMESETSGRILSKLPSTVLQSLTREDVPLCQRQPHAQSCTGMPYRDSLIKETCGLYKRNCHL